MNDYFLTCLRILSVGIVATVAMDLWRILLLKTIGVSSLDLGLLGRWIGHLYRGKFFHTPIHKSDPISKELLIGWLSHYAIGIGFAFLLVFVWGRQWLLTPTLIPALLIGVGTVLAPWFLMQPAMGMGIAASKAPKPYQVRLRNLAIHSVYGAGLYTSAVISNILFPLGMK